MASGDIKYVYVASSNLTVTNLHSLASSQSYVAGWQSAAIDNTSNLYLDYAISFKLTAASSNNQAGNIYIYLVRLLDDSTWPINVAATEGTLTPTGGASVIAGAMVLAAAQVIDNSASRIYYPHIDSVAACFGGNLPPKFVIFLTGNATTTTTAQLAASGNQVTVFASYNNVAP